MESIKSVHYIQIVYNNDTRSKADPGFSNASGGAISILAYNHTIYTFAPNLVLSDKSAQFQLCRRTTKEYVRAAHITSAKPFRPRFSMVLDALSCYIWALFWSILIQNGQKTKTKHSRSKLRGGGGSPITPRLDPPRQDYDYYCATLFLDKNMKLKPMDGFGTWRKWKILYILNAEFYRVVWIINALLTVCSLKCFHFT